MIRIMHHSYIVIYTCNILDVTPDTISDDSSMSKVEISQVSFLQAASQTVNTVSESNESGQLSVLNM